jgi:uncharacterized protein (TIGR03118 family)
VDARQSEKVGVEFVMNKSAPIKSFAMSAIAVGALCASGKLAEAANYIQTDLVSDILGLATITDPSLINPWGVSFRGGSPFWVSNQGTTTATLYSVTGSTSVMKTPLTVHIPTTAAGPQGPTGQVSNSNSASFPVGHGGDGGAADFIFANLNGTISAWDGGPTAFIQVTSPGEVYSGLAINHAQNMIYAANDAGTGSVDSFDSTFTPVNPGAFIDPSLPAGLVPFNVQDIGGSVYVPYAPAGRPAQIHAPLGAGAVAVFNEMGVFQNQLIAGGNLAAPWGIALAPASFGAFGGDLLVGNFSYDNSEINAFNPTTGSWEGTIPVDVGAGNTPGGLWALMFGSGGSNGDPNTLYFADGIDGETHGLFGALTVSVPEPSTWAMMLAGFVGLGFFRYHASRRSAAFPA